MSLYLIFDLDATLIDGDDKPRRGIAKLVRDLKHLEPCYILATHSTKERVDTLNISKLGIPFHAIYTREDFNITEDRWSKAFKAKCNPGDVIIVVDDNTSVWRDSDYVGSQYNFIYCKPFVGQVKDDELSRVSKGIRDFITLLHRTGSVHSLDDSDG